MRVLESIVGVAVLSAMAAMPGCTCTSTGHPRFDLGGNGDGGGPPAVGTISITPADVTLDLVQGAPPATQAFMVIFHGDSSDTDVTNQSAFALLDQTLGTMNANVFSTGTDHGGSTTLTANYTPQGGSTLTGSATIHVKVHGSFPGNCAGCPQFPGPSAPACPAGAAATIVYPPDGVLLPPNLESIDFQYMQGTGDTQFEIDLSNPATDVQVAAKCTPVSDTRNTAVPNGCSLPLDAATWDFIAKSNKGGDPVTVTIRATTDGTCASPSTNTINISFAEQDVVGGIYYWKSKVTTMGTGGDIWRKSFGDATPEEKITPDTLANNRSNIACWGCHSLSRDGLRMTVNVDDSDSDDEYGDVSMGLMDVAQKSFITMIGYNMGQEMGFQTCAPDHSLYLGSVGDGSGSRTASGGGALGTTNQFFIWNGADGTDATPPSVTVGAAMQRPTMPDWSNDNKNVAFVIPNIAGWGGILGFGGHPDDAHIFGGSIWSMPYSGGGMFGTPVELVHSTGDNNYYPSYSPDGKFIIYDHVPMQPGATLDACANKFCPNDSFSNPKARVQLISASGGTITPIDLEAANGSPAASPVDVSNSWPRWTPFLQTYKGSQLLWITFSSTRDYGIRVRNHVPVGGVAQVQCYPADSAEDPGGAHRQPFAANCQQPQLWMAAVNLTATETTNGGDPSSPSFWLPFQDITTHNHSAQWTATVVTTPPPDGGMCLSGNDDCTTAPGNCCVGICLATGKCGIP
ncbi:MAG TPA: hypothetical protein VFF06_25315 [Polyangia bacterium]|nr:hypothetical protein [Polyangia bacterium]